ncbi:hypothetical protein [Larkinella ripae]
MLRDQQLKTTVYEALPDQTITVSPETLSDYVTRFAKHTTLPASAITSAVVKQAPEWAGGYLYVTFTVPMFQIRQQERLRKAPKWHPAKPNWVAGAQTVTVDMDVVHLMRVEL